MPLQTITVSLPEQTYRKVRERAQDKNRTVEDEVLNVVEAALHAADDWDGISREIADEVSQLRFLDDEQLWSAAKHAMPIGKSERMQTLTEKMKSEGLLDLEQQEARQLQQYAQKLLLIRAEAAVLLKQRGHDISSLHPQRTH